VSVRGNASQHHNRTRAAMRVTWQQAAHQTRCWRCCTIRQHAAHSLQDHTLLPHGLNGLLMPSRGCIQTHTTQPGPRSTPCRTRQGCIRHARACLHHASPCVWRGGSAALACRPCCVWQRAGLSVLTPSGLSWVECADSIDHHVRVVCADSIPANCVTCLCVSRHQYTRHHTPCIGRRRHHSGLTGHASHPPQRARMRQGHSGCSRCST
jgi:hypothetical protein